jgi:hypothetical protein
MALSFERSEFTYLLPMLPFQEPAPLLSNGVLCQTGSATHLNSASASHLDCESKDRLDLGNSILLETRSAPRLDSGSSIQLDSGSGTHLDSGSASCVETTSDSLGDFIDTDFERRQRWLAGSGRRSDY